ncbi:MAG: hypothetical protein DDT21_02727 [Syntrophomonadaceae bacterium]|nr:hypothetical protein [Bacillota bacterium]
MLRPDSYPAITHRNLSLIINQICFYGYLSSFRSKLDRIGNQITQNLFEFAFIGLDHGELLIKEDLQGNILFHHHRPDHGLDILNGLSHREIAVL